MFKFKESFTRQNIILGAIGLLVGLALCFGIYLGFNGLTGIFSATRTIMDTPTLKLVTQDKPPLLRALTDGSGAFYSDLPVDYSFRIKGTDGTTANDLLKLVKISDREGRIIELQAVPDSVGFAVIPVSGTYVPGQRYKIELLSPAVFVAADMAPWQTIYFSIFQEAVDQISFQNNVISSHLADFVSVDGQKLIMKSGSFRVGNILLLPAANEPGAALKAYKVVSVAAKGDNFEITTSEPAFDEIFKSVNLNGRYAVQADQIEIDTAAIEEKLKSAFGFAEVKATNKSSADILKIEIAMSDKLPSDSAYAPAYSILLTYEDRPEFALNLESSGQFAFNYISSGSLQFSINFIQENAQLNPDVVDSLTKTVVADLIDANLKLDPYRNSSLIPLIDAQIFSDSSPLSVHLQIDLPWAALLNGVFTAQINTVNAFDAELEYFAGKPLVMANASPTASQLQGLTLIGRAEYSGALQTRVDLSLLQYAEISLMSESLWHSEVWGQFKDWTSNPTFAAQEFNGYLKSTGSSAIHGQLTSRIGEQNHFFPDLKFFESPEVVLGPFGSLNLPLAITVSQAVTFDETTALAALPTISVDFYNLEFKQKQTMPVEAKDLTFKLGDSIITLENGQLPLPASLPLGDTAITVSLNSDQSIQSILTLTKIKPLLSADMRHIADLLKMHKAEVLALLGSDYTRTPIGADGWMDGYAYAASGLTLAFYPEGMTASTADGITEDDLDRVIFVYCDDKTDLNSARVGMTPQQVAAILGTPTQFFAANDYYPMNTYRYVIGALEIDFVSSGDDQPTVFAYLTTKK